METWEQLQARLYHLGYLGEELPRITATPGISAWLYRQIAYEAGQVARIAADYLAECDRTNRHGGGAH
ncbi:MAG: hypothetical protein ACRDRV_11415 [Pseudonocardiaceae bacterium]